MTPLCNSPLWDWDYTWNSEYPRLTSCFENTVLAYTPATFLVPFGLAPLLVGRRKKKQSHYRELCLWTPLSLSRFIASILLTLTYTFSFMFKLVAGASSVASVTADLVHIITFAVALEVQENNRKNGIGSSMLLFFFWLTTAICGLPEFFRHLREIFGTDSDLPDLSKLKITAFATSYSLVFLQLLLSCWTNVRTDAKRPYITAPPLSFLLLKWFSPLILKKSQRVRLDDLYSIPPEMMTFRSYSKWFTFWRRELSSSGYVPEDGSCVISRPPPSLFKSLWRAYWKPLVISCILAALLAVLKAAPAPLLHLLMNYMIGNDPIWKGTLYVITMVSANFGSALLATHIERTLSLTGLNVKAVLMAAIYRKTLRLSSESQRKYTIGELVNLISVDADRIFELSTTFGTVISGVPLIIITLVLLWRYLGLACLTGIAGMLVITSVMALTVRVKNKYQIDQMKLKDKRLNTVAEMLSSVKVLKLFGWENIFMAKCSSLRLDEMLLLKKFSYLTALSRFILSCSSPVVTLASFVTNVLIGGGPILDASTAFVSLTLFEYLQQPMLVFPDFVSKAVQMSVSMTRIREFLLSPEVDDYSVGRGVDEGDAVSVMNATISWSMDGIPALRNINLVVKTGKLIAIVGPVASGKSSLLSALLGNLRVCSGSVDCVKGVAYAPQCPWIQNKTIRENVIFTSKYDSELYKTVLEACCLKRDLEVLPDGDLTEIGEKGVTLSGGQKQRVSLARAAYQKKDLYLFDDPLSGVDAHIGACIFGNLIGPRGMLRRTTRILVTHNLAVLNEVDYIFVMQKGLVVESGTYEELKNKGTALSRLLKNVSKRVQEFNENEDSPTNSVSKCEHEEMKPKARLVERETINEGSVSLRVCGTYMKHAGFLLIFVIFCYGVYTILDVFASIWLKEWTSYSLFLDGNQDLSRPTYRIQVYILLLTLKAVVKFFAVVMLWKVALSCSTSLHQSMLNGVMRAPLSFFDVTPSGHLLNRFGKDIDQLDVQLPWSAHFALELLFLFVSSIFLICANISMCLLIVVLYAVCFLVLRSRFVVQSRQMRRLETVTRSPVNNHFSETIDGLSSVRSYGVQDIFVRDNDKKTDITQACTMNVKHCKYWIDVWTAVMKELALFLMLLLLVISRDMVGTGIAGLLVPYIMSALSSFTYFVFFLHQLEANLVSAERVDEYSRLTPEGPWTSNFITNPHWPQSGAVSFKSYSTRYRDGLGLVLKNINLDVRPGEKLGILGRTGAGKSTMTLSLFRIIEAAAGKIVIDDVNIAVLGLHELRSRIAVIPQDPVLFHGTLRFNLDPAGQHDTAELWTALVRSQLGGVFRKNGGLDFVVAKGGLNLSVGQRQLICLARALLRKTKILVLDEATASVDVETDLLVQQTLRDMMSGCTVLTIAHRIHTVMTSDRVVVMDEGRIVEVGSPTKLLADTKSSFYSMAREAGVVCHRVEKSGQSALKASSVPVGLARALVK
ncbi:multidrug resistance protein, putative [Ixodes scapularis]|uniref:ABC-type glutathione-S-conjugate transporter n=1 Tax=Ixodes scapularis TaxID=6945 RepID=B7P546_IXOSC|nr:multidrug resistance protein, putative [Ixodes scapularis]|eukprot:XP_002407004.1 multidrug resistance protein, putative [Ixodes scapularis]